MENRQIRLSVSLCALFSFVTCYARAAHELQATEKVYQQALRSTAWVQVYENNQLRRMGTGILVDRFRKLVITNQHVVDKHESVEVVFPLYQGGAVLTEKKNYIRYDRPIHGWVIATDSKRDLAVIELEIVPHAATEMRLAADSLCPGERVLLIGNPGSREVLWAYCLGTVHLVSSRKLQDQRSWRFLNAVLVEIRTRTSILPGYSGGPAVNDRGELAGIATMSNPAADWAWCVDISEVRDVVRLVRDYPKAARRLLNPRLPADFQDREAYVRKHGPADHAIMGYSETLLRKPRDASAHLHRGAAFARRGEWRQAVADFSAALELDPNNALVLYNRALAYSQMSSYDSALADFGQTMRFDPKNALVHFDRGLLYSQEGEHRLAAADFKQALLLESHDNGTKSANLDYAKLLLRDPSHATAYHSLAWVWATSPDASVRDGQKALEYANKACELSGWKNANFLGTLAAGYAECGNFKEAVRWQNKALDLSQGEDTAKLRSRVELYRAGRPYRDG
jgi:tetratricopeptide (TPR) repeat protein